MACPALEPFGGVTDAFIWFLVHVYHGANSLVVTLVGVVALGKQALYVSQYLLLGFW